MSTRTSHPNTFTAAAGVDVPVVCGAMYPCSNPELVAAVSRAGGIGIVQPISLTYVHGHGFREGLQLIRQLAGGKPIGMNALIESSSKTYHRRMVEWIDVALEEGVRLFVTSLGKPRWVVDRVAPLGGVVYHDVTERKWALKGLESGVHGLIAVNNRAGGHAGPKSAEALVDELGDLGVPLICAGGVATGHDFTSALGLGDQGVQMGTRFIATTECRAGQPYKKAIVQAGEDDIILSERLTGVPVSVINTPYIERMGTTAGPVARWMLQGRRTKHLMRSIYAIKSAWQMKRASLDERGKQEFWQAGKSVSGIRSIESAETIVSQMASEYRAHKVQTEARNG